MATVKDLISRSVFDLKQKGKNQWLNRREKAIDYYNGDVKELTQKFFGPEMRDRIPFVNINITRRVINRISLVYSEPTVRIVKNDQYGELTEDKNKDMLFAERMTNLLNLILLKVSWRDDKLAYDVIRDFEIVVAPGDRQKIVTVAFPISGSPEIRNNDPEIWEQWSAESIITYNGGNNKILKEEENLFGILPFVAVKTMEGQFSFTDIEPASDLIDANEAINVATANMNANIHFQSFGMAYIIGADPDEDGNAPDIKMGPDSITLIPGNTSEISVGMLNPPDTVTSVKDGIAMQYRLVAQNYHLTSAFVEGNEQAESGVALRIRNQELSDFRKESVALWRTVEQDIYEIEQIVLQVNVGLSLPDEFSVDFGEKIVVLNQSEVEAQNTFDLEHGLITVAQILQRRDPDRYPSEEDAQAQIDKNRSANTGVASLNEVLQSS